MLGYAIDVLQSASWKIALLASFALCFVILQYYQPIVEALKSAGLKLGGILPFARYFGVAEIEAARPRVVVKQFWFNLKMAFTRECVVLALAPVVVVVPSLIAQKTGTGWIDLGQTSPQTPVGYIWAIIVWLLAYDFFYYWWHRLQHAHWFFWASHRVHHSDEAINPSTSFRSHWLEGLMMPFFSALALSIVFGPVGVNVWVTYVIVAAIGFFAHCNLRISFGPWFMSPHFHRIHHSVLPEHQGKNLSFAFPLYDILFGTYYRAAKDEYPRTGLYGNERPLSVWEENVVNFKIWYEGFANWFSRLRIFLLSQRRDTSL